MPNKIAQFANLIRSTKREKKLGTVIFFITSRCNAACETCFYHEQLNTRRHQHANFTEKTEWKFPCTAGETIAVIDYNGDVRACEMLEKFASLADFDYNFSELWKAQTRTAELEKIDGGNSCWCSHVCFIHDSLRHSRKSLLTKVPKNYLLREKNWQ